MFDFSMARRAASNRSVFSLVVAVCVLGTLMAVWGISWQERSNASVAADSGGSRASATPMDAHAAAVTADSGTNGERVAIHASASFPEIAGVAEATPLARSKKPLIVVQAPKLRGDLKAEDLRREFDLLPKNDGRWEQLNPDTGLVEARAMFSPDERLELGMAFENEAAAEQLPIEQLLMSAQAGDPAAARVLSGILFDQRRWAESEDWLLQAVRYSGKPGPLANLSMAYMGANRLADAYTFSLLAYWSGMEQYGRHANMYLTALGDDEALDAYARALALADIINRDS